jgi:Rieske Fe-S protein
VSFGCPPSCPVLNGAGPAYELPVGQIRRIAGANSGGGAEEVDETRRNVLKLLVAGGVIAVSAGGLGVAAIQYVSQPPLVGLSSYPKVQLLDLDGSPLTSKKVLAEYDVTTPDVYTFAYPLRNEPNFLLNLAPPAGQSGGATNVVGGVGPQKSIVAFSAICQHLGCPAPAISYYPPGKCSKTFGALAFYIHCSCHGSTYDVTNGASNLTGPAVLPLPQVTLDWDPSSDLLYAIGVTGPPVNGHFDTLQGDYGVGTTSQVQKQTPVVSCSFPS